MEIPEVLTQQLIEKADGKSVRVEKTGKTLHINQHDLTDIYRNFPKKAEHTFFSRTRETFIKIDYVTDLKTHIN